MKTNRKILITTLFLTFVQLLAQFALAGPGGSNGTNTVGDDLLDDYEVRGSKIISELELEHLAEPILKSLEDKLPDFSNWLKTGFRQKKWYSEPKPLDAEKCKDETVIRISYSVPACQTMYSVRIHSELIEKSSPKLPDVIVHELLVEKYGAPDEGLYEISRAVRDKNIDVDKLVAAIQGANWEGSWKIGRKKAVFDYEESLCSSAMKNISYLALSTGVDKNLRAVVEEQIKLLADTSYSWAFKYDSYLHTYMPFARSYYQYLSAVDMSDLKTAEDERKFILNSKICVTPVR